jgi:hypothetical protein
MLNSLFISGNCSTCFGWYFHLSSGAHTPVSIASGICHTVTAICRYRGRVGTGLSVLWLAYAIKEMRNKKATGDDDVPGDVLKLMGEGGLKIMTKLINTIYGTGEWPKDFTEVTMIALKKKPQATKCSDHRTISIIAHTAKTVAKILRRRIEKKIENVLEEDQFGFRRGKGNRDAIEMLRIISEQTLEIDEKLSVCFID